RLEGLSPLPQVTWNFTFTPTYASLTIGQPPSGTTPLLLLPLLLVELLLLPPVLLLVLEPLLEGLPLLLDVALLLEPPPSSPLPLLLVPPLLELSMVLPPLLLLQAAATASAPRAVRFKRAIPLREAIRPSRRLMLLSPDSVACKAYASLSFW